MQNLRIIINDFSYVEGGASSVALSQINLFKHKGFDVLFLSGASLENQELECEHLTLSVSTNRIKHTTSIFDYVYNIKAKKMITKILSEKINNYKNIKVYIHSWTKIFSPSIFDALSDFNNKVEICIVAHDYFLECPNGGYFNYKNNFKCLYKPLSFDCIMTNCDKISYLRKSLRLIRTYIQKRTLHNLKFKVICVSDFQKDKLTQIIDVASSIDVIPNCLNMDNSKNNDIISKNSCDFIFVGRFEKEKGILELLSALHLSGTTCLFCGSGQLYDDIKKHTNTEVTSSWIPPKKVFSLMKSSMGIIIPSLWYEADPLISIESASVGCTRIVSLHCASSRSIIHGVNGYLIDPNNIFSFAKTLYDIKHNNIPSIKKSSISSLHDEDFKNRLDKNNRYDW
jgi:glycosyltransferase involved in cell wall biosynthesis